MLSTLVQLKVERTDMYRQLLNAANQNQCGQILEGRERIQVALSVISDDLVQRIGQQLISQHNK